MAIFARSGKYPCYTKKADLLAADTTKTVHTPAATETIVVTGIHAVSVTAAAQAVTLQDGDATNIAMRIPASWAVGSVIDMVFDEGLEMKLGQPLIVKPAAAGPAQFWIIDFYVKGA